MTATGNHSIDADASTPPHRRYDSFVVRIWTDPGVPDRILRAEVKHVQSALVRVAVDVEFQQVVAMMRALRPDDGAYAR